MLHINALSAAAYYKNMKPEVEPAIQDDEVGHLEILKTRYLSQILTGKRVSTIGPKTAILIQKMA